MSVTGAKRFVAGIVMLFNRDAAPETLAMYTAALQEIRDEDLDAAMGRVVRRCYFFPSVAEVLDYVDEAREELAERARLSRPQLPRANVQSQPASPEQMQRIRDLLEPIKARLPKTRVS